MSDDGIQAARDAIASADRMVVFSGAGMSAESGIPTFRDEGGIWDRFPHEHFATVPGLVRSFVTQPDRLRGFVGEGILDAARAEPNAAHLAIASAERDRQVVVVTQNIDGLHLTAGSTVVHELHGSLFVLQCTGCRRKRDVPREEMREVAERLGAPLPRVARRTRLIRLLLPLVPRCESCKGRMRPAIVFFGEQLPEDAWSAAQSAVLQCDAMLVVGTSAEVYPAALIPQLAHDAGATVIVVTLDPAFRASWADHIVLGAAAEVVPLILGAGT